MLRILIADCAPLAWERQLESFGARTNAALFEDALRLHEPEVSCHVLHLADAGTLPAGTGVTDFDGVVLTGSPLHICDPTPEVRRQIDFARAVFVSRVPTWGSCWGLQLATVALGGTVWANPKGREIGVARGITLDQPPSTVPGKILVEHGQRRRR